MPFTLPADLPPPRPPMSCVVPALTAAGWARPDYANAIVSKTRPIKVHWDDTFTQEDAEAVITHAEHSWSVQVDEIGFRPPVLPDGFDGDELDIYMSKTEGPWTGWTYPDNNNDTVPDDGSFGVSSYILLGDIPAVWMASYVAHEFNHVAQFATDASEWTYPIWESVATAAQKWTFGEQDYRFSMESFQAVPWAPTFMGYADQLTNIEPDAWGFEYGGVIWVHYLDEVLGDGDGKNAVALWEAVANDGFSYEKDVLDGITEIVGDLGVAMNGVALTRFLVGSDWDARGIEDLAVWDNDEMKVPIAHTLSSAQLPENLSFDMGPMVMGTSYTDITTDGENQRLTASVHSDTELISAIIAFWWDENGNVGQVESNGLNPAVSVSLQGLRRVVVAVSNMGPEDFDCDWDDKLLKGDQLLTLSLSEKTNTTESTSTTPEEATPPTNDVDEQCGCTNTPPMHWAFLVTLLPVFLRRTHKR
jgi:hypothetical protein